MPKRKKISSDKVGATTAELAEEISTCPNCGGDLKPYVGDNPHKAGTGVCEKCGLRSKLES